MNSINSLNDKSFTLNGIQYFRNYVSAVHGNKVEIYNCYERKDVLIPLTHFSEFAVNGSAYTSAAALQVALLDVTYSRITGSDSTVIDQNNVGRTINAGLVGPAPSYNPFFSVQSAVAQKLNAMPIVITAKETPVIITASLLAESATGNYVSKMYKYLFKPGKGNWGLNGTSVSTSHLEEIMIRNYLVDDLLGQPNTVIENLGSVPDGNFIDKANTSDWNFYDLGTEGGAGEKTYYFSYETNDVLYFAQFTGTPGLYGLSYDAKFTTADFISTTDSRIGNTPNLEQVLEQGGNINVSQFTNNGNGESPFATVADTNGLKISINQAAAEMYLKNSTGLVLATINLGFLNNEGTTFFYNEATQKLELKNDTGEVLSEVPVSAFVSNLMHSVTFNAAIPSKLEFKDAEGNVIKSLTVSINNIEDLQAALDGKANKDEIIRKNATYTTDASAIISSGYYYADAYTLNLPIQLTGATPLHHIEANFPFNASQTLFQRYDSSVWTRVKTDGVWREWKLLADDSQVLHKSGQESITGKKTFDVSPTIPDGVTGYEAVNVQQLQQKVSLTGNEHISGTKTFDDSPKVPNATTAYDAVNYLQLVEKANSNDVLHKTGNETKTSGHIAFNSSAPLKFNAHTNYIQGVGGDGDDMMVIDRVGTGSYNFKFNGNARVTGTLKASYAVELTDVALLDQVNSISAQASAGKANDTDVVKLSGNQVVNGIKNFTNEIKTVYGISTPSYSNHEINGEFYIKDLSNSATLTKFYNYPSDRIDFYRKIFGTGAKFTNTINVNGLKNTGTLINNGDATFKNNINIGISEELPHRKKTLNFNVGGYGAAGGFNIDSDGDKITLYNGTDYDSRIGIGSFGDMYFKSFSTSGGGGYSFLTQSYNNNQTIALRINGDGTLNFERALNLRNNSSIRFGDTEPVWAIQKNTDLNFGGFRIVKEGADIAFRIDNNFIAHTAKQIRLGSIGTDSMDAVTLSQLNSGLVNTTNTIAENYIPKAGSVSKTGTMTFTDAPIVPQATLSSHAVNKQQMMACIDTAVSNIMTNIKTLFSPDIRLIRENTTITNSSFNATKTITLITEPNEYNNEPYGDPTVFFSDTNPIDGLTVYIKPYDYPQSGGYRYVIIDLTATGGVNVDGPYGEPINLWHGPGSQGVKLVSVNGKWLLFNY